MTTRADLKKTLSSCIQDELYAHHIRRKKQFLAWGMVDEFMGMVETHLNENAGIQPPYVYSNGEVFNVSCHTKKEGSIKDLSGFLLALTEHGWTMPRPESRDDRNCVYFRWKHEATGLSLMLYVYPHKDSENCKYVEVGQVPKYEWRCV